MLFFACVALALGWRSLDASSLSQVSTAVLGERSGIGAGELLVQFTLFWLALGLRREEVLSGGDLAALALASLCFAAPSRLAASAPVLIVGLKFALRDSPPLRSIGQLLLALGFYEWIGPGLFHLISPVVLKAEAIGVQALLSPLGGFSRSGAIITGPTGHAIYVEEGCSAFHNISFAAVLWISLLKLDGVAVRGGHWAILAVMAGVTIVLNLVRIALMAGSYPLFVFWHDGAGATIISIAMLAAAIAIYFAGRELMERRWRRNPSCGLSRSS